MKQGPISKSDASVGASSYSCGVVVLKNIAQSTLENDQDSFGASKKYSFKKITNLG